MDSVSRYWKFATLLVVVVSAILIFLLTVPLVSENTTEVQPFGFTIRSTPQYGGVVNVGDHQFCPPSGAANAAMVSFVWASKNGTLLSQFEVLVLQVNPPSNLDVQMYNVSNASQGGFSFVTQFPYPCGYTIAFEIGAPVPASASVNGFLTYNETRSVPAL
jgi:hypothetical protein